MTDAASPVSPAERQPRTTRRDLVEARIYAEAAKLFAERGFAATNPQDIAEAVGISRQALYYYVKSKDDLLERLVSDISGQILDEAHAIVAQPLDPPELVRRLTLRLVADRAANRTTFRLLDRAEGSLPPHLAEKFLKSRREALALWRGLIERGVTEGHFRPVDSRVAALSILGMCNWVAWWFEPGDGHPVEPIAEQIADSAVAMLRASVEGDAPPADAEAVVESIESQLLRLKRLLSTEP
ncbi:TetR/AcrR family transcriptional regulator [Actinocorallia sp. A-T 12471]|uniref:TetR/AcrR family transcriptional regulator n=1 Tax=Actinocorallia sp. A-T 12471 TaxID=3089813 RepID=UPI0029CDCAB9|nr:TetR/AcrR family transcriptional regulator [Actinocorallia sp. A-T 12471]MDX6741685.1 TetR/AcrR family transcriptional regulator [Actinocorallia sp. A-T 12471]